MIVNARKPDFFNHSMSLYEIVTPEGLMKPAYTLHKGGLYCGGSGACACCAQKRAHEYVHCWGQAPVWWLDGFVA